jgi:hypothetical protein
MPEENQTPPRASRTLVPAERHVAKHLPGTPQRRKLFETEGKAHVFLDEETMLRVTQEIFDRGDFIGVIRNHERYGLLFDEPIGYRIDRQGDRIPLYYAEKVSKKTSVVRAIFAERTLV